MDRKKYEFIDDKKYLIIAADEYLPMLYKFKNEYPKVDLKIISVNDFKKRVSDSYYCKEKAEEPVTRLLKKGYDYSTAKYYLSLISTSDYEKNEILKDEIYPLVSDLLLHSSEISLDVLAIKDREILLFEQDEDEEIKYLCKKNFKELTPANYLHFEDFDIEIVEENKLSKKIDKVIYFKNKYEQYKYIFSDIRSKLLKDDSLKDKLAILINDDSDFYYVNLFSDLYKIDVFYKKKEKLISSPVIRSNLDEIYVKKSFDIENIDKELEDIIEKYELKNIEFSNAYNSLVEILTSNIKTVYPKEKGILITDECKLNNSLIYYITCFQYNKFYKNFSDSNNLTDKQRSKISSNTSYINTKLSRHLMKNFIRYNNIVLYSRVLQHLNDAIYDSQFIEELNLKDKVTNCIEKIPSDGIITTDTLKLFTNELADQYLNPSFDSTLNIRNYDPSFKGLNKFPYKKKETYSVTDLEKYVSCPYMYYMNKVLPVKFDNFISRFKGTFFHIIFESFNKENFGFEKLFEEAYLKVKEEYKDEIDLIESNKFQIYLSVMKKWLSIIVKTLRTWIDGKHTSLIYDKCEAEKNIHFSLFDEGGTEYKFNGKVDAIIYTASKQGEYVTVIDYKSGKETFKLKETVIGKSIQLPLYVYGLGFLNDCKNVPIFAGFGIKKIYFDDPRSAFYDSKQCNISSKQCLENTKLKGVCLKDFDYLDSFDVPYDLTDRGNAKTTTYINKNSLIFKEIDGKENIVNVKDEEHIYNFMNMIEDSKKAAIDVIKKINAINFEIKPAALDVSNGNKDRLQCSYCNYKDICFFNKWKMPIQNYKSIINARFNNLESSEMEENGGTDNE